MNLRTIYKRRPTDARKGNFGRLLIVGGSEQYTGAPLFAGLAALRAGCDLVTIVAPARAADVAASFLPDFITVPLMGRHLKMEHIPIVTEHLTNATALVIGNGLGKEAVTIETIQRIIELTSLPMVIDADALAVFGEARCEFAGRGVVLTPHAGELAALMHKPVAGSYTLLLEHAQALATEHHAVVLVKGSHDVITDGRKVAVDRQGSPYLTKGGIGDVIAGVTGALLARGVQPLQAARAAAYIVGKAGALAAKHYRESLLASDLLDFFPEVLP